MASRNSLNLTHAFQAVKCQTSAPAVKYKKQEGAHNRPTSLSVRLSAKERRLLLVMAGDQPLSHFAREKLFADTARDKPQAADIARMLHALAKTDVFRNLDHLVHSIESGNITLTPKQEQDISAACAAVLLMRHDLLKALGLRED